MLKLNKEKDNIISIVKSLHPINYLYSKQNRDYDKFFRSSSLKGLIKQINSRPIYNEFMKPGETFDEINSKKNTFMDVNFKSTFNYIQELSHLKNLPLALMDKNFYKRGRYNSDYKQYMLNIKEKKKMLEEEKKKKLEKISHIKNSGDAEVTLDPGRYHPNYDFIKRRYPCAYLGKPKAKENSLNKEAKEDIEEDEIKEIEHENTHSHNENENDTSNQNINLDKTKNYFGETTFNKSIKFNRNTTYRKTKKMNISSPNFFSMQKGALSTKNMSNKYKLNQINKFKEHNTATSWTNNLNLDKSKKINEQFKIFNDKSKTTYKRIKKRPKKCSSLENLRCPIVFDRMPGRDRPINFVDGDKDACRSNYNPGYDIIRPHIPSTIFKCKRKFENFKKYITGKIIRSYCYSPDNYFVFEIKNNKDNNILGNYRTILSKS